MLLMQRQQEYENLSTKGGHNALSAIFSLHSKNE